MLSFFIASLDIESFDIVFFFIVSSAKAAGASASPNDKVAADRMTAVRLIMTWQSPGEGISQWRRMSPSKTSNEAVACYAPGKRLDHKEVSESGCAQRSRRHHRSFFSPKLSGRHKASLASPRSDDSRAGRRMTNRLDAMTVGIQHESGVIVRVILRSKSGRAVVVPSRRERHRVESVNGGAVGSTEADMHRESAFSPRLRG